MKISCPVCESTREIEIRSENKEITIRNEPVRFKMDYRKCNKCGEEFVISGVDKDPLEEVYRRYREKHKMLQPEDIRSFRVKYHLTQGELANLLGLGGATISRYEHGKLQDETHDKLLKLAMDCENLRKLVINSKGVLTERKKNAVLKAIDESTGQMVNCLQQFITFNLEENEPDEYRGFKRFDISKFLNAVLYFSKDGVIKTKLNKLLYYADFIYFKDYTVSITGAQYAHVPFGPAPNNYDLYYPVLVRQDAIDIEEVEYLEYSGEKYIAMKEPDKSIFSKGELRTLKTVKEKFKDYTASDISTYSHQEKGYKKTQTGKLISYSYAQDMEL